MITDDKEDVTVINKNTLQEDASIDIAVDHYLVNQVQANSLPIAYPNSIANPTEIKFLQTATTTNTTTTTNDTTTTNTTTTTNDTTTTNTTTTTNITEGNQTQS